MDQQQPAPKKITVSGKIDETTVEELDALSREPGTVNYRRTRSQLLELAAESYVQQHKKPPAHDLHRKKK